jgi:glutamate---cysteine ligase / carboxylate-amine ligase
VRWTESAPLTLGVEEELMILDATTLELAPRVQTFLGPAGFKTELFAAVLELNTPICRTPGEAGEALRGLRLAAAETAEANGLRIAAAASHPVSVPEEQAIADEQRYRDFVAYAGVSARRQGVQGLHVHVGMPDYETCLRVLEGLLPWLPLVLAVSANSPYLAGRATGLLSNRAEVLAQLPRHGAPPPDWEGAVERMVRLGLVEDYTALWWDARPHPRFGTLEIRVADQPTELAVTVALVTLLQALCALLLDEAEGAAADRAVYEEARWAAAHYGPRARLPHPVGDRLVEVPSLLEELLARVGLPGLLDGSRCEADRQLELGAAEGLESVCADLAARTLR